MQDITDYQRLEQIAWAKKLQNEKQSNHTGIRSSLVEFAEAKSNGSWKAYKWCRYVAEIVEREIEKGGARLILNVPPQHGKSEIISHWLPAWILNKDPSKRIILASYGQEKAVEYAWKVKSLAENGELSFSIARGRGERDNWSTADKRTGRLLEGGMKGVGIGGAIVGFGGHIQILDDPIKNWQEAHSKAWQDHFEGWWGSTFITRLQEGGSIIMIMHRWTDHDPVAWLQKSFPGRWTVISLPAIAKENDPMGRPVGEPLCPERFSLESLVGIDGESGKKKEAGSYTWDGQYQQEPRAIKGSIVRRDQFKYFTVKPAVFDRVIQSWDLAFNKKPGSFVVGQVWGQKGAEYYLLDQLRGRWGFLESKVSIKALSAKWPEAVAKLIENKANGPAINEDLEKTVDGMILRNPVGDKRLRFVGVSPLIEAGNVYLPDPTIAPWVNDYLEEIERFPSEPNDQGDTTSQALQYLRDEIEKKKHVFRIARVG